MTNIANQRSTNRSLSFWDRHSKTLLLALVSLFLLASAVRLYGLQAPGLLPERDFGSAILARHFFYQYTDTIPEWSKEVSRETVRNIPLLEPPVTEFLVSVLYWVIGSEQLWIARLLTSSFWLISGLFLFKIARMFLSTGAALASLTFYLFAPLGILLSRSFQPDALMMFMYLASLLFILKYNEQTSNRWLVVASIITGITLLYRPIVLFTLSCAFLALAIEKEGSWKGAFQRSTVIFFFISFLPTLVYYGYGAYVTDGKQEMMSFQPHLYLHKEYWRGWIDLGVSAVGFTALAASVLGLMVLPSGWPLAFLLGLWVGYCLFGLTFTYHIHTHPYYHAQLIPIVALSFGPLIDLIGARIKKNFRWNYRLVLVVGITLLAMFLGWRQLRTRLSDQRFESKETAQAIGDMIDHSAKTVFVAKNYGIPLQYNGQFTGSYWPRRFQIPLYLSSRGLKEFSVEERLNALDFIPEYFVITDLEQLRLHHLDLSEYLEANCSPLAESDDYLVYAQCT